MEPVYQCRGEEWQKVQSGRNYFDVGVGVASKGWEKGVRGSKGICMFLDHLQLGSEARAKTATKPLVENPGEQCPKTKLSAEGGESIQYKKDNITEMYSESVGGCRMKKTTWWRCRVKTKEKTGA